MVRFILGLVGFLLMFVPEVAFGQVSKPDVIRALRVRERIRLDGLLNEAAWQQAEHISNFTQRELNEGAPATEWTEVAVLYDDANLYVGVWCYDSEPERIVAEEMKRDFSYRSEDNFKLILDTYHDGRNGYLFVTNPNGARFDALVQDNGQSINRAWDGVWDVKTRITPEGWFAEFRIPFSTLKFYRRRQQVWGINFERNIRRKREQVLWQGWSRNFRLEQVSHAGTLVGIEIVGKVTLVELKPYGTSGTEARPGHNITWVNRAGFDVNYLITPAVKFNFTVNTDFAQVESDRIRVNLTRFSLFYPEKREFFLEGSSYFSFSLGGGVQPFYSRRIGLAPDRSTIPILGGVRVLGKTGRTTLGAMSIQTARKDTIPSTNYTVFRVKRDVGKESSIGFIGVGKFQPGRQNVVYGVDFLYSTSRFMGSRRLVFGAALAQSYTSDRPDRIGAAYRLFLEYPNDRVDFQIYWNRADGSFNPETGFLRRKNFQKVGAELRFKPRPAFLPWIQRLVFKPFEFDYYIDENTGRLQSFSSEFRPFGFTTRSGEMFEANIQREAEYLTEDFEIFEGQVISAGEYWFTRYELQFRTFSGRRCHAFFLVNWGDFYRGQRTRWFVRGTWKLNRHVSISSDFSENRISLPGGEFAVHEIGGRIDLAASPDLFGSVFGQWNNEDKTILLNFRMNWIPTPGTNFYFVVNQAVDTAGKRWKSTQTTVLTKLIWRFVI